MKNLKFSIITPTHSLVNLPYLIELYESISDQTYKNWEWVLFLNGKMKNKKLPKVIEDDNRVVVHRYTGDNKNIGFIKKQAFSLGSGDILVEADHDDLLIKTCLSKLNKEYKKDKNTGFVFSDDAVLPMNGDDFTPYNPELGWTHKTFNYKNQNLVSMNTFEPSSHSLCYIWYAPDHVRSWRKSIYEKIGGHNEELNICDDHELMIRTYLVTKMKRIPEALYIYRVTGENTFIKRNEAIQIKTQELFDYYAMSLAIKDADEKGLSKIDIGGGKNAVEGFTTVDLESGDIDFDLNDGIPFPDNSVGVLHASHIIEHLHDKHKTMSEIHRVLAHGGWAFIEVPSTDGRGAFQDPTHCSYWNENSFLYYTQAQTAWFINNKTIKFQEFRKKTWFPNDYMRNLNICVTTAVLVANKEGGARLPHSLLI